MVVGTKEDTSDFIVQFIWANRVGQFSWKLIFTRRFFYVNSFMKHWIHGAKEYQCAWHIDIHRNNNAPVHWYSWEYLCAGGNTGVPTVHRYSPKYWCIGAQCGICGYLFPRGHLTNFHTFPQLEIFTIWHMDYNEAPVNFLFCCFMLFTTFLRFKVSCISFVYVLFYVKH